MENGRFLNKYRIPSARAAWHKYNGGLYFVTICTQKHDHYFGEIVLDKNNNANMNFTEIGCYTNNQLSNISKHYPYAEIPLWIVMPNHIHALIIIDNNNIFDEKQCGDGYWRTECRDVARNVSTVESITQNTLMSQKSPKSGSLSVVVRGFKSAISKFARENKILFDWQTRFHDHIVRDNDELNRIADYITNNPARWNSDKFYN